MKCPNCSRTADSRQARCFVRSAARPTQTRDRYGSPMAQVPIVVATVYRCAGCGWTEAGVIHDGVFLPDHDLVPMGLVLGQLVKYEQDHADNQNPGRHEPGE